ncbi:MAG: MFS transporter [Casimicrobiaceae bacterium]
MNEPALSRGALWSYGLVALPLAMAALPIYVQVPKFYADTLGIDLAVVGFVLLSLRLADCLIDPLLGGWSDRFGNRARLIGWSLIPLGFGMIALFTPPAASGDGRVWWLAGTLALVFTAYSAATINHQAWGSELSTDSHQRTRITATREALALIGVLVASIIPGLFSDEGTGLRALAWMFAAILALCGGWTVWRAPHSARIAPSSHRSQTSPGILHALLATLRVDAFRKLLAVFVVNGIAAAIPATLVLFFVKDVIGAEAKQGWFLGLYFLAAAAAMPAWITLARRVGKARAWIASMVIAIASFIWAMRVGAGDTAAFLAICAASGIALSADLALPSSMLADAIDHGPPDVGAGSYFGLWTLATKLNLALAAGIALPLVQWFGYRPGGGTPTGLTALTIVYAGVPCFLKLCAVILAWRLLPGERAGGADATQPPRSPKRAFNITGKDSGNAV